MNLPEFIKEIISKIASAGYEAYVVGGSVRDGLLGLTPSDWDLATSAVPEAVLQIFANFRTIPTGLKHGTVTVLTGGNAVEITTFRLDGKYTDSRHPESVAFTTELLQDLKRRDFTVNAMAYNEECGIVDPFGGQADLSKRLIRCVGTPEKRFFEDALRIMRALRFSAVLDFEIAPDTASAVKHCAPLLAEIAAERIFSELSKLLLSKNPAPFLTDYRALFGGVLGLSREPDPQIWHQNAAALSKAPTDLALRLALLTDGLFEKAASLSAMLDRLRCDKQTKNAALLIASRINTPLPTDKIALKKELSVVGEESLKLILKAQTAKSGDLKAAAKILKLVDEIRQGNECYTLNRLAVNGNDLRSALGLSGKDLGICLNSLLDAVILEECPNTSSALLELAGHIFPQRETEQKTP